MVASNLNPYLDCRDKNGVRIGDWATQVNPGFAACSSCVPSCTVKFEKGKLELTKHSETVKHIRNAKLKMKTQPLIKKALTASQDIEKEAFDDQVKDLEIILVHFLSRHHIPPANAECLVNLLRKYIPDSEIVQKLQLGREKARYITEHGVSDIYEEATVRKLKKCDAFAVAIDESEVNKRSELEMVVTLSTPEDGIETMHYKSVDLEAGDAETITNTVFETFSEDKIDFKSKLVDAATDGCSTMLGEKSGVIKRMKEEVPQLRSTGSCKSHNLSNTMQHATTAFDPDIKAALVDVHQDLGGAKGRGLKKKKEFEVVAREAGIEPKPFKRFVSTRFRTLRMCIEPVLHNYEAMTLYYKSVKKPSERQKRLQELFVNRCDLFRIKLKFIFAATSDFCNAVDFFEQSTAHVHSEQEKLEDILMTQLRKTVQETELQNLDEETNEMSKKSGRELLKVELEDSKLLKNSEIFIGRDVEKEIKALGLSPSSVQLAPLFESIKKFHKTACSYLQKYFVTALKSDVLENMSALAPRRQKHALTGRKLKQLVDQYDKVIDTIQSQGGVDKVKEEIDRYVTDLEVSEEVSKEKGYEHFWTEVGNQTDGAAGWERYEVLPRFALAMGTKFSATGDVERGFSQMNMIHQNKQRNEMSQDMLDSHMHIRSGVESKENRKKCKKCKDPKATDHCHCMEVEIDSEMRNRCRKAWEKCKMTQTDASNNKKVAEAANVEKRTKYELLEVERKNKVKEDVVKRATFYSSNLMQSVYPPEKKESEKRKEAAREEEKKERVREEKKRREEIKARKSKDKDRGKLAGAGSSSSNLFAVLSSQAGEA